MSQSTENKRAATYLIVHGHSLTSQTDIPRRRSVYSTMKKSNYKIYETIYRVVWETSIKTTRLLARRPPKRG